jgi:ankyrin repeat protein
MRAIIIGDIDLAALIISNGANVYHRSDKDFTPLMYAVVENDIVFMELLIENGAVLIQ